jgi:peptidoglycan hydrolase-like protein with peptidoglycan-binding domain
MSSHPEVIVIAPPEPGRTGLQRLRRRRISLLVVAAVAIAAAVGGLLIGTTIKSPAQVAAQTAPPALTRLSVPVTHQFITGTVLAQGVVKAPPEVSQLAGGGGGSGGALPVVTKVFRRVGSTVGPGSEIVEVAGRPLVTFLGSVPAYRSLSPGDSGTDVLQLQQGLESLGYSVGEDTGGVFGTGTGDAVTAFYTALGYPVPTQPATVGVGKKKKTVNEPMVPQAEIMFVPSFPARVIKVAGPLGKVTSGSLVTLALGSPAIAGQLSPSDGVLVKAGMAVKVTDPAAGSSRRGHIESVGARTETKKSISGGVYLPAKVSTGRPLPLSMIGQDVSLTIAAARSAGKVLAVPEAAVFARADGRLYVTKMTGSQSSVAVPVRVGVTGNGMVGVTPIDGGTLAAGDRVAIGADYARTSRTAR